MTQAKVSICIPSYNHGRFLPQAIESALAQTHPFVETIIVDDGSTDDSLEIAQSYAAKNPSRIRVFTHPGGGNLGISATINSAFRKSSGEYWSLLASDDLFYPHKTARQVSLLENHREVGWVYSHAQSIDEHGRLRPSLWGEDLTNEPRPIEKLIAANRLPATTVLVRRKCMERVGLHTETLLYGDWEFWVRLAVHYKVAFIKESLAEYRIHDNNVSLGVERDLDLRRALEVMDSLRINASQYGPILATPRTLALLDLQRARYLFHLAQSDEAVHSLKSAFEIYPSIQDEPRLFLRWVTDAYLAHVNPSGFHSWVLGQLPANVKSSFRKQLTKSFRALALAREARECYQTGDFQKARQATLQAQVADPHLLFDRQLLSMLGKTMAGSRVINKARQLKHRSR